MDKKSLSEIDIITQYTMPALFDSGWNLITQIRQELKLRDGKIIVRGQLGVRKTVISADIVLYHKPNIHWRLLKLKPINIKLAKVCSKG